MWQRCASCVVNGVCVSLLLTRERRGELAAGDPGNTLPSANGSAVHLVLVSTGEDGSSGFGQLVRSHLAVGYI